MLTGQSTDGKHEERVVMMMRSRIVTSLVLLLCSISTLYYINMETRQETGQSGPLTTLIPLLEPKGGGEVELSPCQCKRRLAEPLSTNHSVTSQQTTCSQHSARRGDNQRVVSFSYYEKNEKLSRKRIKSGKLKKKNVFFQGLEINLDLLPKIYPGTKRLKK